MDLQGLEYALPASHYEQVTAGRSNYLNSGNFKKKALQAMNELDGWCTKEKATVLMDLVLMLKPQRVVEIGVFGGKSLVPMAFAVRELGSGIVIGIDPWSQEESAIGMDGGNLEYWGNLDHDRIYKKLTSKISKFGLDSTILLIRKSSEQADPIGDIDMIHIDGNHSEEASLFDVNKWVPLVRKGGIIVFDDVNWESTNKATAWLDENCIKFAEFHADNIWGIWIKP